MKRSTCFYIAIICSLLVLAVTASLLPSEAQCFPWDIFPSHERSSSEEPVTSSGEDSSDDTDDSTETDSTTASEETESTAEDSESTGDPTDDTDDSTDDSTEESSEEKVYEPIVVGEYLIDSRIAADVVCPDGFILAYDVNNFVSQIQAFYSPSYQLFVYHGTKNNVPGYFVYNKRESTMMDFILVQNRGDSIYAVIQPAKLTSVPGIFICETTVTVTNCFDAATVEAPAFAVRDALGNDHILLYLSSDSGRADYYIFSEERGIPVLVRWDDYMEDIQEETTEEVTEKTTSEKNTRATRTTLATKSTEKTTVATQAATETEEEPLVKISFFRRPLTWILICVGMFLLVLFTVLTVFSINRRQDEEEAELDEEYEEENMSEDEDDDFGSSYSQARPLNMAPFEVNFEDAFPEELHAPEKEMADEMPAEAVLSESGPETPVE